MCFSPTASFTAGTVLYTIGVACLWRSKTFPYYALSMIPVMLGIQQCSEGMLWLSKLNGSYQGWYFLSMYTFLIFAQAIWPIYIPFSVYLLESSIFRKKALFLLMVLGILIGTYLGYGIFAYPVTSVIDGMHIKYIIGFPGANTLMAGIIYCLPTAFAPFFSSHPLIRTTGIIIVLSNLFTLILFPYHVVSVWCYFAAAISIVIFVLIFRGGKPVGYTFRHQSC